MKFTIKVAALTGFCGSVEFAVRAIEKTLANSRGEPVYSLGLPAHNDEIISRLSAAGLVIIDDAADAPENSTVVLRAHGATTAQVKILKGKNCKIIDAVCRRIRRTFAAVDKAVEFGETVVFFGSKTHPEALAAQDDRSCVIIADEVDDELLNQLAGARKIFIVGQSSKPTRELYAFTQELMKRIPAIDIEARETICSPVKSRLEEAIKIASQCDLVFVAGSKKSSNANSLLKASQTPATKAVIIETEKELDMSLIKEGARVGIVSATSCPLSVVNEIVCKLVKHGGVVI